MHMAQLMPLPLTVSCFSKIQIGFTFLVPAHPSSPGKRAVKWMCVCVCSAGHTVYYCGRYSRWAAIRTRRFPSKSCSTCYATDIAWTDQRMLHTKCAYLRTHILRSRRHQFSLPRLSTVLYKSRAYVRQSTFVSVYLVLSFLLIVVFFFFLVVFISL